MKNSKTIHARLLAVSSLIIILDQATKYLVRSFLIPYRGLRIIPGFFDLVYVMNKGGAFGLLSDQSPALRGMVFVSFSIATILALVLIYLKSDQEILTQLGIAFLIGGAIGNLVDRLRWGMVVDFLDFYIGRFHWPAFNIADMAICIGLGLVLWDLFKNSCFCHE